MSHVTNRELVCALNCVISLFVDGFSFAIAVWGDAIDFSYWAEEVSDVYKCQGSIKFLIVSYLIY